MNYLAVEPGHRRNGYGALLVAAAERRLAARGCPKVNLQVRSANDQAVAFYERLGYATDDVVSLGKRLADAGWLPVAARSQSRRRGGDRPAGTRDVRPDRARKQFTAVRCNGIDVVTCSVGQVHTDRWFEGL